MFTEQTGSHMIYRSATWRYWNLCLPLWLFVGWAFVAPVYSEELPINIQVVGNHRLEVGETLELQVLARQPFGQVPWLFAESQPLGSTLEDNGDGTRTFRWTPQIQDIGESTLRLVAAADADQTVRVIEEVRLTVLPANSVISRLDIIAPVNVAMTPNQPVSIRVVGVDADGLVPDLIVLNLPTGASFDDNGDGSRSIHWTPPYVEIAEGNPPFHGVFAVQASAADDPDDKVQHIISFVVTDDFPPYQQDRLEPLPQIFAPPAPSVVAGELLSFRVEAFHASGQVPSLMVENAPENARFEDNGDGSREFIWLTQAEDLGINTIRFVAVDSITGDINTFDTEIIVLASELTVRADRIITLNEPLTSLSVPDTSLEQGFDISETEYLIDVEFLVDSVDILINERTTETFSLLPGSNRLIVEHPASGVQYRFNIDRATQDEFGFENQIGLMSYDLDVDGNQIALATPRNVLIFTWEGKGDEYTRTAGGLDQQPWVSPAAAVSLSGDTLAVASNLQDGIWIYEDFGIAGWQLTAHLQPDPMLFPQGFGSRVVLDGDTLVVSSIYDSGSSVVNRQDATLPGSGAVAVFHRDAGQWALQEILKASNPDADDLFGVSMDLQGDILVVGAVGEDSAASGIDSDQTNNDYAAEQFPGTEIGSGAAYVFERFGDTWRQSAYLKPSENNFSRMGFGQAVAISDDRIAVTAVWVPYAPANQSQIGNFQTGAVYVFDAFNEAWQETGIIRPAAQVSYFGTDLALQGDQLAIAAGQAVILYQHIDDQWRTLWSTNLLYGHVDFNAPFLIGPGMGIFAESTMVFSSGR